jgi:hypothetical protein
VIFVADADARIRFLNHQASTDLGLDPGAAIGERGGQALDCVHSYDDPGGCGRGEHCRTACILHRAIGTTIAGGEIRRERLTMKLRRGDGKVEINLLLTAVPFRENQQDLALVTLEDVSEIFRLRSILPICSFCKKIRDDQDYWESVEHYIAQHADVHFSHGFCPECVEKHYGAEIAELERAKAVAAQ